jgi:RNA polymerase subunit RPABC4/transcription elongation factor Spt4
LTGTGSDGDIRGSADQAAPWPVCSECGRRRQTVCPVCGTAGDEFPRADGPLSPELAPNGEASLALICSTCDEPFVAEHLRYCPWCGSDAGAGIDVDSRHYPVVEEPAAWNGRAVAVGLGVLAVMALLAGYLMALANR